VPTLQRDGDGERAVTTPASTEPDQPEPEPTEDGASSERLVSMIRVRCNPCRRAWARAYANQRKGGFGLPKMERPVPTCPHYKTVWAPGFGPGAEPPEDSGWDWTPPV
jgi:hypothetical protein